MQPDDVKLLYFKPRVFDLAEYIKGCKDIGIRISECVAKKLNSFRMLHFYTVNSLKTQVYLKVARAKCTVHMQTTVKIIKEKRNSTPNESYPSIEINFNCKAL